MKVVVVGYGSIGKRHIGNISKNTKYDIIVCSKKPYDDFLKQNKCQLFSSLNQCINLKPDVAFITNETHFHISSSIKLAKAGCHLFIEKPLSDSLHNIDKLMNIVKKKKLITIVGCDMRFHPCIQKIKEIISLGKLGKVISIKVENGSYLPDWHPDEDYRKSYAALKKLGGGVVLTCIHELDYLYWIFGNPIETCSISGRFSDLKMDVEDLSSILLRFKNNVIGEVHLDYFQKPITRSCKIIGTKGTLYWDSDSNLVKIYNFKNNKWKNEFRLIRYTHNKKYVDEINHFFSCIKNKKKTINDINQGLNTLKIALAIKKSSKTKKTMRIA